MYEGVKEWIPRNRNEWKVSLKEVQSERDMIQKYFKINEQVI